MDDSHGALVAEFACQRGVAVRAGELGPGVWGTFRRAVGGNAALKGFLSHVPGHIPTAALGRVAGMCCPIETVSEVSQGDLVMDHEEVQSWLGWHHHMTLCL